MLRRTPPSAFIASSSRRHRSNKAASLVMLFSSSTPSLSSFNSSTIMNYFTTLKTELVKLPSSQQAYDLFLRHQQQQLHNQESFFSKMMMKSEKKNDGGETANNKDKKDDDEKKKEPAATEEKEVQEKKNKEEDTDAKNETDDKTDKKKSNTSSSSKLESSKKKKTSGGSGNNNNDNNNNSGSSDSEDQKADATVNRFLRNVTIGVASVTVLSLTAWYWAHPGGRHLSWKELYNMADQIENIIVYDEYAQITLSEDYAYVGVRPTMTSQTDDEVRHLLSKRSQDADRVPVSFVGTPVGERFLNFIEVWSFVAPFLFFPLFTLVVSRAAASIVYDNAKFASAISGRREQLLTQAGEQFQIAKKTKTRFRDIAGMTEAKSEIVEIVDFLKNPERFTKMGAKIPAGALLLGPPGTGKTMLARAVAGESDTSFIACTGSDFVELYAGMGALRVRKLFELARKEPKCIIYIDEIDAIGGKRTGGGMGESNEQEHTLNELLTQLDGFNKEKDRIIILASTNAEKDQLDNALTRPGRFDRMVNVETPVLKERLELFETYLKTIKLMEQNEEVTGENNLDTPEANKPMELEKTEDDQFKLTKDDKENDKNDNSNNKKEISSSTSTTTTSSVETKSETTTKTKDDSHQQKMVAVEENLNSNNAAGAPPPIPPPVAPPAPVAGEAVAAATRESLEAPTTTGGSKDENNNNNKNDDDENEDDKSRDKKVPCKPTPEFMELVKKYAERMSNLCPGFVGADIASVCNEAAILAAREKSNIVTMDHLERSVDRVLAGIEHRSRVLSDFEKKVVAHHEAGHAVAGWFLGRADPLMKVSIVPRGGKALGYAQYLPNENQLRTSAEIEDSICVTLGGRVAEKIFFDHLSTGASDDLQKIRRMAYMHASTFNRSTAVVSPGSPQTRYSKPYGEVTEEQIDEAAKQLVDRMYQRTYDLLLKHKGLMEKLAEHLMKHEVITHTDILHYMGPRMGRPSDNAKIF